MAQQKMGAPVEDCLHMRFCQEWWRNLERDTEMAVKETNGANELFLKELNAEKPSSTFHITFGELHALRKRGFVDVARGKQMYGEQSFTALQILDPGSAPLAWDPSSPFKLGYDYYAKWEDHENDDGSMKKILVHSQELKEEFLKNLPNPKHLFIWEYYEGHEQLRGNAKNDHRRPMISKINALFDDDMNEETIDNLLCNFLAVFFRILAVKSSELKPSKEITVMDDRKEFFLTALKTAKQTTYTETSGRLYDLKERGFFDVIVAKDTYNKKSFTALQILDPGSAQFSQALWSPMKLGYDYYGKCEKHEDGNGRVQNIFVHTKELEMEFRKHLPDLKNLFIHPNCERHEQLRGTAKEDMIYMINAHFENDITPETIDNLLATFLAAFFTILEVQGSKITICQ